MSDEAVHEYECAHPRAQCGAVKDDHTDFKVVGLSMLDKNTVESRGVCLHKVNTLSDRDTRSNSSVSVFLAKQDTVSP